MTARGKFLISIWIRIFVAKPGNSYKKRIFRECAIRMIAGSKKRKSWDDLFFLNKIGIQIEAEKVAPIKQYWKWCDWLLQPITVNRGESVLIWIIKNYTATNKSRNIKSMDNYIPFILIPFIYWGVLHHLKKKDNLTSLKKITLFIGIAAFSITELGRSFYRPYIYANKIDDYFIADTIGNSFGTVTAIFMVLTLSGKGTNKDWRLVSIIIVGLLVYELLNLTGRTSIDINDIIATVIFGIISVLIYFFLLKKYGGNNLPNNRSAI